MPPLHSISVGLVFHKSSEHYPQIKPMAQTHRLVCVNADQLDDTKVTKHKWAETFLP